MESPSNDILGCLTMMDSDNIRDCSEYQVFKRGEQYYKDGLVEKVVLDQISNRVLSEVEGTELYQLEFYLEDGALYATCDCPYDDVCKHMVATLLHIVRGGTNRTIEIPANHSSSEETRETVRKHLRNQSKTDLIDLVMNFAPPGFYTEIINRQIPETDAKSIFRNVKKALEKHFHDDELLYDPESMEAAMMTQLEMLRGMEDKLQEEIGDLILWIIKQVDKATYEGYLYVDHYYDDYMFESEAFCEYVVNYAQQLPFDEKIRYLLQLDHEIRRMSYDIFGMIEESYPDIFKKEEIEQLGRVLSSTQEIPQSLLSQLIELVGPVISEDELEALLHRMADNDEKHLNRLVQLLISNERFEEAHDRLAAYFSQDHYYHSTELACQFLEVSCKLGHKMQETSEKAIRKSPDLQVILKIKELNVPISKEITDILRDRNPKDLLAFYEESGFYDDALKLANQEDLIADDIRFDFYRKHRKRFSAETEEYLVKRIELNLANTGKQYYAKIGESLDLFKRVNPERTSRIAQEIQSNFKRRSNLMMEIKEFL
jgi:hypothetical protein